MEDRILYTARYMEGDLDEAERMAFETQLAEDVLLQDCLKEYQEVKGALARELRGPDEEEKALRKTLILQNERFFREVSPKKLTIHQGLKWAYGIAAILIVGIFIWAPWKNDLYRQYAVQPKMIVVERGEVVTDSLADAAQAFNEKKFATAVPLLEALHRQNPEEMMITYYYAVALFEVNQPEKAGALMTTVFNSESVFRYDAAYFLALYELKQKRNEAAIKWLLEIPAESNAYERAHRLLKALRS